MALIFSASSYKSIETIIYNFNNITTDTTNVKDKLSYITKNILQLSNKAQSLEYSFITKMNELKTMQLSMLQLQFTPHFLFNTLNTVSMLRTNEAGIDNPALKIIMLLSDLLAEALDTSQYIVTINNEINYSKKYVEIEKIKNNNSFDTVWEVDSSLLNCKTIKFSLQPIIENSIRYGIKELRGKRRGYKKISITSDNDIVKITVFDNGNKINSELLEQIRQNINAPAPPAKHRGMYNVNKRIQLVFGYEYGCSIDSDNTGTSVTIHIPRTEALN